MAIKPTQGIKKVLFFQAMDGAETTGDDLRLAFQQEHTLTLEREALEEATKDGSIKGAGEINASLSLTSFVAKDDATYNLLKESFKNNEMIQGWEVDVTEESSSGKYEAIYFQGTLTSFEESASTDGFSELSTDVAINLIPQEGEVTLTDAEFTAVQYAFRDFGELNAENSAG